MSKRNCVWAGLIRALGALLLLSGAAIGKALADEVPVESHGVLSTRCGDAAAPPIATTVNDIMIVTDSASYQHGKTSVADFERSGLLHVQVSPDTLDVPFSDNGGDGQAAWCATSIVTGLDPDGDGFLSVRAGPGTQYRKLDELRDGDQVSTCDSRGPWVAIVYGPSKRRGWVHGRWLKYLAG
jgi:hypothetical protein